MSKYEYFKIDCSMEQIYDNECGNYFYLDEIWILEITKKYVTFDCKECKKVKKIYRSETNEKVN